MTPTTFLIAILIFFLLHSSILLGRRCVGFRLTVRAKSPCRSRCAIEFKEFRLRLTELPLFIIAKTIIIILPAIWNVIATVIVESVFRRPTWLRWVEPTGFSWVEAKLSRASRHWLKVVADVVIADTHCGICFRSWILVLTRNSGFSLVCSGSSLFLSLKA